MGRFHYWLGKGQVTKLRPVRRRLPICILNSNSFFYLAVTYSHTPIKVSSILTYQNLTNAVPFSYCIWYLWVIFQMSRQRNGLYYKTTTAIYVIRLALGNLIVDISAISYGGDTRFTQGQPQAICIHCNAVFSS
jgi:hypothetical protein